MIRLDCIWLSKDTCTLQKDIKEFECYGCDCCFSLLTHEFKSSFVNVYFSNTSLNVKESPEQILKMIKESK